MTMFPERMCGGCMFYEEPGAFSARCLKANETVRRDNSCLHFRAGKHEVDPKAKADAAMMGLIGGIM